MSLPQPAHVLEAHFVWSGAAQGLSRDAATFSRNVEVSFAGSDEPVAREIVEKAHRSGFIANSVSTAVDIEPRIGLVEWVEAVKGIP